MAARILVTGGTGFIGSYLLRYLVQEGYGPVRALKRSSSSLALVGEAAGEVEWVDCDLLDVHGLEQALRGIRQVYHAAALVSLDPAEKKHMMRVNREGTAHVVDQCLHAGIEKLVYVSSIAALGKPQGSTEMDEGQPWEWPEVATTYGLSKYLAELEVWRGMQEGLPAAIALPSVVLGSGPWEDNTMNFFRLGYKGNRFYPAGAGGFVDVRDVARFLLRLMESEIQGERFLVTAENHSYRRLMSDIADLFGTRHPDIRIGKQAQRVFSWFDWLGHVFTGSPRVITSDTVRTAGEVIHYRNDKSRQDLDFEYTPISRTLQETCRQYAEAAQNDFAPLTLPLL
jgi:nucleoside-diphosphate-sugar epimerase